MATLLRASPAPRLALAEQVLRVRGAAGRRRWTRRTQRRGGAVGTAAWLSREDADAEVVHELVAGVVSAGGGCVLDGYSWTSCAMAVPRTRDTGSGAGVISGAKTMTFGSF